MAISSTYIGGDTNTLKSFLEDSGLFDSVTISGDVITIADADSNTLATFDGSNGLTLTAYSDATHSASRAWSGANYGARIGYKCANGVLILVSGLSSGYYGYWAHILISKTNNNKVAFVFSSNDTAAGDSNFKNFYSVAWGDSASISSRTMTPNDSTQTQLVPFLTTADVGDASYTPKAFFLLYGQFYSMGYGKLNIENVTYLTNGYWAIKDS